MVTARNLLFSLTALSILIFSQMAVSQTWTTLPDINNPRFESSAVQYKDDVYVFNGFGPGIKVESSVEKFDADTKNWSVIAATSATQGTGVTHNGVIRSGSEVWIIGGRVGNHPGAVTSKVWKFNLDTEKWSDGPGLPVPVAAGGAALVNNKIYWFGGLDRFAQCDVDHHYVYNLKNPAAGWKDITSTAPMPMPRNHFATVVHNGLIYAIGGQLTHDGCGAGTPDTNLVHVFNPNTNTWTQKAGLPAIQSHIEPSTFVHKNAIYVIGGATFGNKIYRYDPATDHWDTVATLPKALLAPVARVIDEKLIVSTGGAPSLIPSKTTYVTDMAPLELHQVRAESPEQPAMPSVEVTPQSLSDCVDSDPIGDGWGWNGTESCRVITATELATTELVTAAVCVDPDGDGWGWNGQASCRVSAADTGSDTNTNTNTNTDTAATSTFAIDVECIDTDGDGWGWNGTASCSINNATPSPANTNAPASQAECTDLDGDGWGWDGTMSCRP